MFLRIAVPQAILTKEPKQQVLRRHVPVIEVCAELHHPTA
jgi:hypothetical protein